VAKLSVLAELRWRHCAGGEAKDALPIPSSRNFLRRRSLLSQIARLLSNGLTAALAASSQKKTKKPCGAFWPTCRSCDWEEEKYSLPFGDRFDRAFAAKFVRAT